MEQVRTTLLIKRNYYSKMFFEEDSSWSLFFFNNRIYCLPLSCCFLTGGWPAIDTIQYRWGRRHRLAKHWPHKTQHPVPNYFRIKNRLNRHKYNIFLLWLFPNSASFLIKAIYRRSRNDPITLPVLFAF